MQINIKDLNFRTYQSSCDLKADEERDLFPPRFIVDLMCLDRGCMLYAQCKVSCIGKSEKLNFSDLVFSIYIPAKRFLHTGRYDYVHSSLYMMFYGCKIYKINYSSYLANLVEKHV